MCLEMEEAVMCDEGVMGSDPLSIREQMVNAAKKYLGRLINLPYAYGSCA